MYSRLAERRNALLQRVPAETYLRPTIASVSPASASMAGGTSLAVTGTDFMTRWGETSISQFSIGAVPVQSFSVGDAKHATLISPALDPGTYPLILHSSGGDAVLVAAVTVVGSYAWQQQTISPGISPRDGAMMSFLAGKWWIIGGWNASDPGFPANPAPSTNEVWSSPDLVTWTLRRADTASPPISGNGALFKRRHWHGQIVYTDAGTPYIYVMGGDLFSSTDPDFSGSPSNGYQCDVWRSPDGLAWARMASSDSVSWSGRMLAVFGQSPGKLWCFGGQNGLLGEIAGACKIHNDLHVSTDGGATWSVALADAAPSSSRPSGRGIINQLPYWRGLLWLVGGGTYDSAGEVDRHYFREVWSLDPAKPAAGWTRRANPPWVAAEYTSVEVFGNQLWLMGGYSGVGYGGLAAGQNTRWVYSSTDGDIWRRRETPLWLPSHADATAVSGNTLGHAMGNASVGLGPGGAGDPNPSRIYALVQSASTTPTIPTPRAAWRAGDAVLSGSNIVSIPDSTGHGHHLVAGTPGDAVLIVADADFGGAPSASSPDGGFFLHTTDAVDLSAYTLFVVGKFDPANGFFYHHYASTAGTYEYVGSNRSVSYAPPRAVLSIDVHRSGVSTTGAANSGVIDQTDVSHIYTTHYIGTAAETFVAIDGAVSLPDDTVLTGDAGTGAWSAILYLLSATDGSGSKAGKIAEARLYPALTLVQRQAVQDELRGLYPYKTP